MKPAICKVCGKAEWAHVCGVDAAEAARLAGVRDKSHIVRDTTPDVPDNEETEEGVRGMSDEELRPYVREWERRRKAERRGR